MAHFDATLHTLSAVLFNVAVATVKWQLLTGGKWAGLALMLPRSAERRRHSDVSPSALKELSNKVSTGLTKDEEEITRKKSLCFPVSSATDTMLVIPPRSPELRRHSDVSAASLKELQKLQAGGKLCFR